MPAISLQRVTGNYYTPLSKEMNEIKILNERIDWDL